MGVSMDWQGGPGPQEGVAEGGGVGGKRKI